MLTSKPTNGIYFIENDYEEFQNYFSRIYPFHVKKTTDNNSADILTKSITFVVTERCNLNCTYCYEKHSFHKNGKRMTKEIAKQAVDFILNDDKLNNYANSKEHPGVIIDFIGGEPLLEIDLIDYICDYFKLKSFEMNHPWATNYMFNITTNGLLFNSPKVLNFIEKNKSKLSMSITIDGNKELHDACRLLPNGKGSYDIVEKSVKTFINKYDGKSTKLTIAPGNVNYLFDAIKNLWDMGLQFVFANCVYEEGWKLSHAKVFYNELKKIADYLLSNNNCSSYYTSLFKESMLTMYDDTKNYCGGNGSMLAIGPDGICYPCLRFMQHSMQSNRKEITCGDIYNGLLDPQKDKTLCELCAITVASQSPEKCKKCKIKGDCGLCTAYNYDKFGNANIRATYICVMHQARVLANAYYWNKLYKKYNIDKKFELDIPEEWALQIISMEEFKEIKNI